MDEGTRPQASRRLRPVRLRARGRQRRRDFVVGLYVDNLQIVHSVDIDDKGNAPPGSFCASFLKALNETWVWDVIDEGPMVDLLGIQVRHNADGSITLNQEAYIDKLWWSASSRAACLLRCRAPRSRTRATLTNTSRPRLPAPAWTTRTSSNPFKSASAPSCIPRPPALQVSR